jgi:hypothetical protein
MQSGGNEFSGLSSLRFTSHITASMICNPMDVREEVNSTGQEKFCIFIKRMGEKG